MGLLRNSLLWASESRRLRESLPRRRFFRRAASRFMPGEDIEDALGAAEDLREHGIGTLVTYLGEHVKTEAEAAETARRYCDAIDRVRRRELDCQVSPKLTQLGLDLATEVAFSNLRTILTHACEKGDYVWIDMESSDYLAATLEIYARARKEYRNLGLCVQSYLYRAAEDLESLLPLSPGIRLVKGAYAEPPELAFSKKEEVDANFQTLSRRLLSSVVEHGVFPAFATHDLEMIRRVQEAATAMGVSKDAYEFQLLYGIRRDAQLSLARDGYRVRVLISYGSHWFSWYLRRLAERPANLWFVLRNLFAR